MEEEITKLKILDEIQAERNNLDKTQGKIPGDQMLSPGLVGNWTVKDMLAHITVWEQRMVRWLEQTALGDEPEMLPAGMTWDDLDLWNEQTYQEHLHRDLQEVLSGFQTSYQEALKTVREFPEEDLIDPERYAWRNGRALWLMVAANTYEHYKEHEADLAAWLERLSG